MDIHNRRKLYNHNWIVDVRNCINDMYTWIMYIHNYMYIRNYTQLHIHMAIHN